MGTVNWIGAALPYKHVDKITIGGTWLAGETLTITGLGMDLVVTVGSLVTVAQVVTTAVQAWNAQAFTDTTAGVAPIAGGQSIPPFADLTATAYSTYLLLVGDVAGVPMPTFTVSTTSASGTISISHTQAGTGPNDWSNTANWDTGVVPVAADDVVIDRPVSILFGLAQSAVTLTSLTILDSFDATARIGNPVRNVNGYNEWRATELAISATTLTSYATSGLIKINLGTVQSAVTVYSGNTSSESNRAAFQIRGTHASSTLAVLGSSADVGWGSNDETATVLTVRQTAGQLTIGRNVTLTTVSKLGGTAWIYCALTTMTNVGTLYLYKGAITTLTINGGNVTYLGTGTVTTTTLNNTSILSLDGTTAAVTLTTVNLNNGSSIIDSSKRATFTNPIVFQGKLTATAV